MDTNNNGTVDDAADQAYTLLNDERGTPIGIMDKSRQLIELLFYNSTGLCRPYHPGTGSGEITRAGQTWVPATNLYDNGTYTSSTIRIGWTGLYRAPFTGKYHAHLRDYDPLTARWLSEDPMGYQDGLNLYAAYMGVEDRDPTGAEGELKKTAGAVTFLPRQALYWGAFRWIGGDYQDPSKRGIPSYWLDPETFGEGLKNRQVPFPGPFNAENGTKRTVFTVNGILNRVTDAENVLAERIRMGEYNDGIAFHNPTTSNPVPPFATR